MEGEGRVALGGEEKIGAEGRFDACHRDRRAGDAGTGGEMPPLVELAIVRQKDLRHGAEQHAPMDDDAAIEEASRMPQRRADDRDGIELAARREQPLDLAFDLVEKRVLEQQILDCVSRQTQFGKEHHRDALVMPGGEEFEDLVGILQRLGDGGPRNAGGDPDQLMRVRGKKRGHPLGARG